MRIGASVSQLLAESSGPRGARTMRALSIRLLAVMGGLVSKSGASPSKGSLQDRRQRLPRRSGKFRIVGRRPIVRPDFGGFAHIAAAGQLHLQRMDAAR